MAKITQTMMAQVLSLVGGSGNVAKCGNCMTRLRLTLNNSALADHSALKKISGVMGVVESDAQLQIILGPGKAQTAADMMNALIESGDNVALAVSEADLSTI
ncbi:PTS transporter subunit EIIB, partial [Vibrio cholerae]|nr:PTS transporter subunit EIIB [Vibrio cholerae]